MSPRSKLRKFRFRNMTVVHEPSAGPITALALSVRAGARFDRTRPGLAHMAEHMLFQGTTHLDQLALNRRAAELGGSHNASTGYESIALTIEVFNDDFPSALALLTEQFYRTRIDPARFRKEREVVLDEIRTIRDDPLEYVNERAWETFYGSPIGHPICGTPKSLRELEPSDVAGFLKQRFVNANATLAIVGGVDEETLRSGLARYVHADRAGESARASGARRGRNGVLRLRGGPRGQAYVTRILEIDPDPRNILAVGVALDLVGADPDSALFQAVRERHGIGYDVGAEIEWGAGWAAAALSASARPGVAEKVAGIVDEVVAESARAGFAASDLARARKKQRYRYASMAERRLDRALAHADCVATGFPSLEESERIVDRLDDAKVVEAWQRAASGRTLLAMLPG